MLARAQGARVDAVIAFVTDADRLDELAALVRSWPGFLYLAAGVHCDNVKRAHDKLFASKAAQLRALAATPECVAIFAGLDGARDVAATFAQEKLLKEQLTLAADMHLPVLLDVRGGAAERTAEIWAEHAAARAAVVPADGIPTYVPKAAVLAFDGGVEDLDAYLAAGLHIALDGALCDPMSDEGARLRALVPRIPLERLLLASNSPLRTPQNIADHVIKSTRNEPSNLPAVVPALAAAAAAAPVAAVALPEGAAVASVGADSSAAAAPASFEELASLLYDNAVAFFRLSGEKFVAEGASAASGTRKAKAPVPMAAPTPAAASAAAAASRSDCISDHVRSSGEAAPVVPVAVEYRCRMCRFPLFTDSDVMAHDGRSIKPSLRTLLNVRADEAADAAAAAAASSVRQLPSSTGAALVTPVASPSPHGKARGTAKAGRGQRRRRGRSRSSSGGSGGVGGTKPPSAAVSPLVVVTRADDGERGNDDDTDDGGAGSSFGGGGSLGGGGAEDDGSDDDDDDDDGEGEDTFDVELRGNAAAADGLAGRAGADGGGGGVARPLRPKFADGATVIDTGEGLAECAVGRWHVAKGRVRVHDEGVCRNFLVDKLAWMDAVSQAEPEGALACPGCRTKVGVYSLAGLKCSCGLAIAPAFKVPKARVDAMLHGIDTLDIALAAASMDERGAELGGLAALARVGEDAGEEDGGDGDGPRERDKSGMRVPVSKHKGNFNQFRNKVT